MMEKRYSSSTCVIPQEGRTEVFFEKAHAFSSIVRNHVGAFLNTSGGVIHFGVRQSGYLFGISCSRSEEDKYRLEVDNIMKFFQPKVSPSLYRMEFIPIDSPIYKDLFVISIYVSPGTDIMYMDGHEKVKIMLSSGVYGPLKPQEIQRIAIHKYKQEILNAENLMKVITPFPKDRHQSKKLKKKKHSPSKSHSAKSISPPKKRASSEKQDESRQKVKSPPKVFSSISTQTTPKPQPTACSSSVTAKCLPTSRSSTVSSDPQPKRSNKAKTAIPSTQVTPERSIPRETVSPDSVICIDDTPCNSVICIDDTPCNSSIIIIRDSSDSDCCILDDITPIRHSTDLFASPECSTLKRVTQVRPDPQSPSSFPPKTKRKLQPPKKRLSKHQLGSTPQCEGTCSKRAKNRTNVV